MAAQHSHSDQQHGQQQHHEGEVDERLAWVCWAGAEERKAHADERAGCDERLGQRGGFLEGEANQGLEQRDEDGAPAHSGHGGEGADLLRERFVEV